MTENAPKLHQPNQKLYILQGLPEYAKRTRTSGVCQLPGGAMFFRPSTIYVQPRMVADALEHFWDYAYLGNHSLAQLECVRRALGSPERATHLECGHVLHHFLRRAIDATQIASSGRHFSQEALFHSILCQVYVEGLDNLSVAKAVHMSERTFYRHLAKAVLVVAQLLDDWECATRGRSR